MYHRNNLIYRFIIIIIHTVILRKDMTISIELNVKRNVNIHSGSTACVQVFFPLIQTLIEIDSRCRDAAYQLNLLSTSTNNLKLTFLLVLH